jgi:predicted nucleic acid-binding protein
MIRAGVDTNILAYAEGVNGSEMQKITLAFLRQVPAHRCVVPIQVLGELFLLLVRKGGYQAKDARKAILTWEQTFMPVETTREVLISAVDLSVHHHLRIWDAVILSATAAAGCRLLLTQDMQAGFFWNGVTVVDPFSAKPKDILEAFLEDD